MNKWEYKKVAMKSLIIEKHQREGRRIIPNTDYLSIEDDNESELNKLGQEGWELTSSKRYNSRSSTPMNIIEYIFKREVKG